MRSSIWFASFCASAFSAEAVVSVLRRAEEDIVVGRRGPYEAWLFLPRRRKGRPGGIVDVMESRGGMGSLEL